jgi:large subunit ribosomal protein L22
MEFTAKLRHLQASPQKVRLVADMIRGCDVEEAAIILKHTKKRAARPLEKLLKSAIANAEHLDEELDIEDLYVKEIFVDGGPAMKRIWFTTMGRAFRKLKRQSHVTLKLHTRPDGAESGRRN